MTVLSLSKNSLDEKTQCDDSTKAAIISYTIDLLNSFSKTYQDVVCFREIFEISRKILDVIISENNPNELKVENNFIKID